MANNTTILQPTICGWWPLDRPSARTRAGVSLAVLSLVACQRGPDSIAPPIDSQTAMALQPVNDTRESPPGLPRWIANRTPDATPDKVKDAAVGAAVASALTREPTLRGYHIGVDSASGRIILIGLAPDTVARSRASELAARVDGVLVVQNQMSVAPPPASAR